MRGALRLGKLTFLEPRGSSSNGGRRVPMRHSSLCGLLAATAILCVSSFGYCEDGGQGKYWYLNYCASCHGTSGKGDGSVCQGFHPKASGLDCTGGRQWRGIPGLTCYRNNRREARGRGPWSQRHACVGTVEAVRAGNFTLENSRNRRLRRNIAREVVAVERVKYGEHRFSRLSFTTAELTRPA